MMFELSFERLLDAAIEAMDGFNDFLEEEVLEFVLAVEDCYDCEDYVSCR